MRRFVAFLLLPGLCRTPTFQAALVFAQPLSKGEEINLERHRLLQEKD